MTKISVNVLTLCLWTPWISHHCYKEPVRKMYTATLRSEEKGSWSLKQSLVSKPQLHEWCLECSFLLKLVVVSGKYIITVGNSCFLYKIAWHLLHNFHYKSRLWQKNKMHINSLVSAQTFLVYKYTQVLFLLPHGHATFIQAHTALTKWLAPQFLCALYQ